jgi:hypothetical protein
MLSFSVHSRSVFKFRMHGAMHGLVCRHLTTAFVYVWVGVGVFVCVHHLHGHGSRRMLQGGSGRSPRGVPTCSVSTYSICDWGRTVSASGCRHQQIFIFMHVRAGWEIQASTEIHTYVHGNSFTYLAVEVLWIVKCPRCDVSCITRSMSCSRFAREQRLHACVLCVHMKKSRYAHVLDMHVTSGKLYGAGGRRRRATLCAYLRTWHAVVKRKLYMHNAMKTCMVTKRIAVRRAVAVAWKRHVWSLTTSHEASQRHARRLLKRTWTFAVEYGLCVCVLCSFV